MLSKAVVRARPSVLWCYKSELGFSSHRKKRMRAMKKRQMQLGAGGATDADGASPFDLFISATDIRYTYYSESHKIMGRTFGMCVLQDFEAITPNLLARTIETVEGGGIIVILLHSMHSLRQLCTLAMDVHARYRTESHKDVVGRFNERFLLSLGSCRACLVVDDELNVLPLSSHTLEIQPVPPATDAAASDPPELVALKQSLADAQPAGALVALCKTTEQAKATLSFVEAISEKVLRSTVALTAARGRGKSAALGIATAAAVAFGYANIFVTSPSPENLGTLFQFVFKAFDALNYKEHLDYEVVQSLAPEFNKAIVRVNVFREHRQTIQYIHPGDADKLGQAELVVIDEAAAIPLPLVRSMLGPYLVFMASTVNGYEGTGRSLSLKLVQQLRAQAGASANSGSGGAHGGSEAQSLPPGARRLRELTLQEPIRYASGDPIEAWLNDVRALRPCTCAATRLRGTLVAQ